MTKGLDVIFARCKQVGACKVWTGPMTSDGRPQAHINRKRSVPIRRLVLEERTGEPVPKGRYACCTCDTYGCVNHVAALTRKEQMELASKQGKLNVHSRSVKQRQIKRASAPKMTMEKANLLRERRKQGATLHELADEFGIHFSLADRICKGTAWAPDLPPVQVLECKPGRYEVRQPTESFFSSLAIGSYINSDSAIARAYSQQRA